MSILWGLEKIPACQHKIAVGVEDGLVPVIYAIMSSMVFRLNPHSPVNLVKRPVLLGLEAEKQDVVLADDNVLDSVNKLRVRAGNCMG